MTRRSKVLFSLLAITGVAVVWGYLYLIKYDIRREQITYHDDSRNRDIPVEIAISRRAEIKSKFGFKPRVAFVNHANTVKNTEYSFFGDVLATQGYLVIAIQHDMPGDPPLSMQGFPFLGRIPSYQKGEKNILFVMDEVKKLYPGSDFSHVTMFGHSQGGDIAMWFAGQHPEMVNKIVTLDNIRVPVLMSGKQRILTLRSNNFKPDPGVVPTPEAAEDSGVEVVQTDFQHDHLSDRGPDFTRDRVRDLLAKFLIEDKAPKPPSRRKSTNDTVSVNYTPPATK